MHDVRIERRGHVAIITLDRPAKLNALSPRMHHELNEAVGEAAGDDDVRAVVITGAGRGFCSGGDLTGDRPVVKPSLEERLDASMHNAEVVRQLHEMTKPTLGVINGVAAGAGLALALACDLRIGSASTVFTTAFARIGLSGDLGISHSLNRLVGPAIALEMLMLSEPIDSAKLHRLGLLNRVVSDDELLESGLEMALALAEGPPVAYRHMKRNIRAAQTDTLNASIEREVHSMARCSRTQDVKEAMLARKEKRAPRFTGR